MNKPLFALGVSLLLLGIGMLYGVAAVAQGFDACIAQYQAGGSGWCKVSDDVFYNVRLTDAEANIFGVKGSLGSRAVMIAWNGGALDPDSLIMYFHGGGHNDYYGNEWYAYDIKEGAFERLNDPSPLTHYYYESSNNKYCQIPDPALAPNSAHTYDGVEFYQSTGTIILINQGTSALCGSEPVGKTQIDKSEVRNIYEFNPSRSEVRNGLAPLTYRNLGRHNYTYPRSVTYKDKLLLGSNTRLYEYSFSDGQAVEGASVFSNPLAGQGVAEVLNNEVVTYLNAGFLWTFNESGSTRHISNYSQIPNAGGMACGVTECLFWSGGQSVSIWDRANPTTYTEIKHPTGPTDGDYRVYSKLQYIPGYDVYIGVSNTYQPVHLYRVSGEEVPDPPPAPDPTPDPEPDPIPDPIPEPTPDPIPDPIPDPVPQPVQTVSRLVETDTVCSNANWRVYVDGVQLSQTFQREYTMVNAMTNALIENPGAEVTSSLNVTCRQIHTTEEVEQPVGQGFISDPDLSTLKESPVLFSNQTAWTVSDGQYLYTVERSIDGGEYRFKPVSRAKLVPINGLEQVISSISQ